MHARPFAVPADLYPFADHWFERGGAALHYVDHGAGVPVVMLHGNPTWSFLYRDVIRACPEGIRRLPDANHYLQEDEPDPIAAAIGRVALGTDG